LKSFFFSLFLSFSLDFVKTYFLSQRPYLTLQDF